MQPHPANYNLEETQGLPLVSLLVCTYNRASLLEVTLNSLLQQEFGLGEFEIIVVDNASTDETKEVVKRYSDRDKRVRYVYEPQLGVAVARNTGAKASAAPYIAYFDDDLRASPDCLQWLMTPFFAVEPKPAAVMGAADLWWEGERPTWFPEHMETMLSKYDRGNEPRFMVAGEYLITMNVAFDREIFLKTGGINPRLSRKGRMFITGGDNEIFARYIKLGLPIYYEPRARIEHYVPPHRQTRQWLLKRLFGDGSTQALMAYLEENPTRTQLMKSIYFDGRRLTRFGIDYLYSRIRRKQMEIDDASFRFVQRLGHVTAHIQLFLGREVHTASE